MSLRIILLNERHRTKEVFASLLLNESPHKQNQLRIAQNVDGTKSLAIDPGVVHVKPGFRKPSFQSSISNELGDANKRCGFPKQTLPMLKEMATGTTHSNSAVVRSDIK